MLKKICDRCGAETDHLKKIEAKAVDKNVPNDIWIEREFCVRCHAEVWDKLWQLLYKETQED